MAHSNSQSVIHIYTKPNNPWIKSPNRSQQPWKFGQGHWNQIIYTLNTIYIYIHIYIFVNFLLKSHSEQWMGGPWLLTNKRHWSHNLLHFVGRGRAQLSRGTLARVAGFSSPLAWMTPGRSPRAALQQTTEPDLDVGPPSPATAAHGASETPNGSTWRKASANSGWLNGLIENPIWRLSKKGLSHVDARWTFPFQLQGTQI